MKSKVDKLDIGKIEASPVDLSKLSNVVKNDVVKKTEYDELIKKVKNINTTDTSDLVKNTDYNTKIIGSEKNITDHDHDKYITSQEFNKLVSENFATRLAQANLAGKNDFTDFVKKTYFDDKIKKLNKNIPSNKTKHVVENKLQTFDSSLFIGQSYFGNDQLQNFLLFQPIKITLKRFEVPLFDSF